MEPVTFPIAILSVILFVVTGVVYLLSLWLIRTDIDTGLKGHDQLWQIVELMARVWLYLVPLVVLAAVFLQPLGFVVATPVWVFIDTLGIIVIGGKGFLLKMRNGTTKESNKDTLA